MAPALRKGRRGRKPPETEKDSEAGGRRRSARTRAAVGRGRYLDVAGRERGCAEVGLGPCCSGSGMG